jgi:hypothetical protein
MLFEIVRYNYRHMHPYHKVRKVPRLQAVRDMLPHLSEAEQDAAVERFWRIVVRAKKMEADYQLKHDGDFVEDGLRRDNRRRLEEDGFLP